MRRRLAAGDVAQRLGQGGELAHLKIDRLSLFEQPVARQIEAAGRPEHGADRFKRKAGHLAERDQLQLQQHLWTELTPEAMTREGRDQADLFIVAQRGRGDSGPRSDLADIEQMHA